MHLDLSKFQPGAWVKLSDVPSWDTVRAAYKFLNKEPDERIAMLTGPEGDEFIKVIFESMLDEWNLLDRKGVLIPCQPDHPFPTDGIGRKLDGRIVSAIFGAAQGVIVGGNDEDADRPNDVSA